MKGTSGVAIARHASRGSTVSRRSKAAAISSPESLSPFRAWSNAITSRNPAGRAKAATVAESYPEDIVPSSW